MIVRGDSYDDIYEKTGIGPSSITRIKKRNPDTVALIKQKSAEHKATMAAKIYDKANRLLEKRLDKTTTARDLVAVSHEMFNQSQIESGQPTQITSGQSQAQIIELAKALESGDEVELQRIVFKNNG